MNRKTKSSQRRAQAEKVKAWSDEGAMWRASTPTRITWDMNGAQVTTDGEGPILLEWCDLRILNASDMPVSGFSVDFYVREEGSGSAYMFAGSHPVGTLMPGEQSLHLEPEPDSQLLRTMSEVVRTIPSNNIKPPEWNVGYSFTDHAGVRWRLNIATKALEEVRA